MFSRRSVMLCVLLILKMIGYIFSKPSQLHNESKFLHWNPAHAKICSTHICNETASELLKNMDFSVNPCDNFYQFVCGGYSKSAIIPNGLPNVNVTYEIHQSMMARLATSLEKPILSNEPKPLKLVKIFYQSCMDTSAIELHGVESLLEILKKIGGWPVIEENKWNGENFEWTKTINVLQKMGYLVSNMPQVLVDVDIQIITQRSIYLILKPFLDKFAPLANEKIQNTIRQYMIDIAVELGANRTFAEEEFKELFYFVSKLHQMNLLNAEEQFAYPMEIKELSTLSSTFPWQKYVENMIPSVSGITPDDEIIVVSPKSIESLNRLMNETSKRVQANFIMWDIISLSVNSLKKSIRDKYKKLLNLSNMKNNEYATRKDECINMVSRGMPIGISALYVRNHFDKNIKDDAIKIAKNIRHQMNETLRAAIWPNALMKRRFTTKFEKLLFSIGYPEQFFNDSKLGELYQELNFTSPNYHLYNSLDLMSFILRDSFVNLRKPVNKRDWKTNDMHTYYLYSLNWNTYYLYLVNSVVIPISALEGISNKRDIPNYMKYGTTGFFIGHEMYHAFDSRNRNFDEIGYKVEWDDVSKKFFNQTDSSFIEQYESFNIGGTKLNGPKYLNENFADNEGAKVAYSAYLNWTSQNAEPELQLPGLLYNPKQMFWISLTNNLCEKRNDTNSFNTEDNHFPPEIRVTGVLSHVPEFARDFDCPANSKMNHGSQHFI